MVRRKPIAPQSLDVDSARGGTAYAQDAFGEKPKLRGSRLPLKVRRAFHRRRPVTSRTVFPVGTAQVMAKLSEASSLVIVETQASPIEPRFQHTVLFTQKRDHVFLLALQPPAQHRHQQWKHRRSLRQSPDPAWDTTRSERRFSSRRRRPRRSTRSRPPGLNLSSCRSATAAFSGTWTDRAT